MKLFARVIASVIIILLLVFLVKHQFQQAKELKLMSIHSVSELEREIGNPTYVYSQPGGQFGKEIISELEFSNGLTLRAYLVQNMPPRFLVIKVDVDGNKILRKKIEKS